MLAHLVRIISSYLPKRILLYDTDEGAKKYKITGGVPQGSVLGHCYGIYSTMECCFYPLSRGVQIIGYADDVTATIVAKELHQIMATYMTTLTRKKKMA